MKVILGEIGVGVFLVVGVVGVLAGLAHCTRTAYATALVAQVEEECPACDPKLIKWLETVATGMRGDIEELLERLHRLDAVLAAVSGRSTAQLEIRLIPTASAPPLVQVDVEKLYWAQYCLEAIGPDGHAVARRCP